MLCNVNIMKGDRQVRVVNFSDEVDGSGLIVIYILSISPNLGEMDKIFTVKFALFTLL